jgi:hypothetical protein
MKDENLIRNGEIMKVKKVSGSATIVEGTDLVIIVPEGKTWYIKKTEFAAGTGLVFGQMKVDGEVIATSATEATINDAVSTFGNLIIATQEIRITGTGSTAASTLTLWLTEV